MNKATLEKFAQKRLAILRDDGSTDMRAALVAPAEGISEREVNTLLLSTGGHLYVALSPTRVNDFALGGMADPRDIHLSGLSSPPGSFSGLTSVEAREGISTGISAADRATTIAILGEKTPASRKLVKPGHIFPVLAREGGVLVKNTIVEGALDVARLSGFTEAAVYIDLLDKSGELLEADDQEALASSLDIPIIPLSALVRYRLETEQLVYKVAEAKLPTLLAGELKSFIYKSRVHGGEHLALVKGDINPETPVLTRVQAESTFADVFGGANPPSRRVLHSALKQIGESESGVLIYLRRPEGGHLQEQVRNWTESHLKKPASMMREYGLGAQILRDLGVKKIELLTGSKKNLVGLQPFGLQIISQRPLELIEEHELPLGGV
jgi:3,4-dihydroxy 2-butanone 4-phosphate synthase/GTP cyclohydrolase II